MTRLAPRDLALMGLALAGALTLGATLAQELEPAKPRPAPDFTLTDLTGKTHRLSDYLADGKVVVLEWFNPDCPFVRKHHQAHKTMAGLEAAYRDRGVVWLAINSGAPGKQGAGAERSRRAVGDYGIAYPVCLDEDGRVGRAYGAKVTPHMFVVTPAGEIAYEGAIDDDRSAKELGKTNYVREALEAVLAGEPVAQPVARPYGCSIKYASPDR